MVSGYPVPCGEGNCTTTMCHKRSNLLFYTPYQDSRVFFATKSMVTLLPLSDRRLESPLYPLTGTVDAEVDGLVEAQDLACGHTSQPLSCLGEGRGIGLGVGRGGAFAGGPLRLRVLDLCPVGLVKHVFRVWGRSLLA